MKQKFHRLCNRHRWIPVVGTTALMAPLLAIDFDTHPVNYVLAGVVVLLSFFVGASHGAHLMNPTVKTMHDYCDPYPLLAECDDQLSYVKNRGNRQQLTMNRAAALIEMGRCEDALASLEALNIDDPYAMPIWRYVYYHNTALAAFVCGQREKAEIYEHKSNQQAASITEKKWQPLLQSATRSLYVMRCLDDGDYDSARRALEENRDLPDTLTRVHHAYQWGRLELAQNNHTAARFHLEFVVQYGNRLAIVDRARALLADM